MKTITQALTAILFSTVVLVGCNEKAAEKPTEPAKPAEPAGAAAKPVAAAKPAAADPAAEAKTIFDTRCVTCHGATGLGDGPAASALNPKPRSYADAKWQAEVKDEDLIKAIVEGGPAIGKSPLMPPNPDLKGKDAVLKAMVAIIRSFKPAG